IGVEPVPGAARAVSRPRLGAPPVDAHKYVRGLLAVVGGTMPGAALLACDAAQGAGAGYVKLLSDRAPPAPAELVIDTARLPEALADQRIAAVLIGPGLGRHAQARERLAEALVAPISAVLDADALVLLGDNPLSGREAPLIATPHEG